MIVNPANTNWYQIVSRHSMVLYQYSDGPTIDKYWYWAKILILGTWYVQVCPRSNIVPRQEKIPYLQLQRHFALLSMIMYSDKHPYNQ